MQIQITFAKRYPAVFDTRDLTDGSSIKGVVIATFAQLSYAEEAHPDPVTGRGRFAPGLWCHVYGHDYNRRGEDGVIQPTMIGHVPVLSQAAMEEVLEVKANGQAMLKRDPKYGLLDLQTLYTVGATYLDNAAGMAMVSLIGELSKHLSKANPGKTQEQIAELVADRTALDPAVVAEAMASAALGEGGVGEGPGADVGEVGADGADWDEEDEF